MTHGKERSQTCLLLRSIVTKSSILILISHFKFLNLSHSKSSWSSKFIFIKLTSSFKRNYKLFADFNKYLSFGKQQVRIVFWLILILGLIGCDFLLEVCVKPKTNRFKLTSNWDGFLTIQLCCCLDQTSWTESCSSISERWWAQTCFLNALIVRMDF